MELSLQRNAPWQSGLRGARANILPGVILQLMAVVLGLGYYYLPAVHGALTRLLEIRKTAGFSFGILSTALFGGILPFLYIRFSGRTRKGNLSYSWLQGTALTLFWAYKGFEVDLWYRIQARMFGSGHEPMTIIVKVICDQFVYCPILAVPVTTAVYQAVDAHGNWNGLMKDFRAQGWYRRRVLPILISNVGVWVPAVAVIYCLPTPLQLPLQNIVLCFYTLVVAHQIRSDADISQLPSEPATVPKLSPSR
jgi:hypothetical protein